MTKNDAKKSDESARTPLVKLLTTPVKELGMPPWAIRHFRGMANAAVLYYEIFLRAREERAYGPKTINAAVDALVRLGLPDELNGEDPFRALVLETRKLASVEAAHLTAKTLREREVSLNEAFAEELRQQAERLRKQRRTAVRGVATAFRRREQALTEKLKRETIHELALEAPKITPEHARHWLSWCIALGSAGDFSFEVELIHNMAGIPLLSAVICTITRQDLARILNEHDQRSELETEVSCIVTSYSPDIAKVTKMSACLRFVSANPSEPATLQGTLIVPGVSDDDIKAMLRRPKLEKILDL